jgi:hypothetical protein
MAPAAAVATVAVTIMVLTLLPGLAGGPRPEPSSAEPDLRPSLIDVERLRTNSLLARAGVQPWASEARALRRTADRAVTCEVDAPTAEASSYRASAIALGTAAACAYTLAVAATMDGDPRFTRRAAELAMAWAETDPCPLWGRGCDGPGSVAPSADPSDVVRLDAAAAELVLAADLIRRRGGFSSPDAERLAAWLARLTPTGAPLLGPDGDLEVVLRITIARFIGDPVAQDAALAEWRRRLSLIRTDGRVTDGGDQPLDLDATQRSLGLRLLGITIAGPAAGDMLAAVGPGGIRLQDAVDALVDGMEDPAVWPAEAAPAPGPIWELAYALWGAPGYRPLLAAFRELELEGDAPLRWSSLVFGLADSRVQATAAPASTPTDVPTASPISSATPAPTSPIGEPSVELLRGSVASGTVRVGISWVDRTGLAAGTVSYRVQYRQDGGRWQDIATTDRPSVVTRLPVGPLLELRVRAAAGGATTTRWTTGEPFALSLIEAEAATRSPASAWRSASSAGYTGRTLLYAEQSGATISFVIEGRGVALRVPAGPTRGQAQVRVDGGPAVLIDEFASRFSPAVILFVAGWDVAGRHEIEIEVLGTPGRETFGVDALVVLP